MKRRNFVSSMTAGSLLANTARAQIDPAAARARNDPALLKATDAVRPFRRRRPTPSIRFIIFIHPRNGRTTRTARSITAAGIISFTNSTHSRRASAITIGGHARSRDPVNWEHLPIALWPSAELGETAIFSGGAAIADDGRPRLFFTSIGHPQPELWMAIPEDDDLIRWKKYSGNPVVSQATHINGPIQQCATPSFL